MEFSVYTFMYKKLREAYIKLCDANQSADKKLRKEKAFNPKIMGEL